jgi:RimJ/RimL family protein N-acetyltransferase
VTTVRLSVSGSARAAQQLYEKIGFKVWGVEPDAMIVDERLQTEHHMSLLLKP